MSISSAIATKQQQVADSYTAVSDKGGTLPQTQNLTNLATAISSIPSGGGTSSKYGINLDNLIGDIDSNGNLTTATEATHISFDGVQGLENYALAYMFYQKNVESVLFPDLITISGSSGLNNTFYGCKNLTSIIFPNLITISGSMSMYNAFYMCTALTSVTFPKLTTISGGSALNYTFSGCTALTSVTFPELATISSSSTALSSTFSSCLKLARIDFPKLTTISSTTAFGSSSYSYIFYGCSALKQIHFKSTAQSVIKGLNGYSTKWGATNATIYFDL